MGAYNQRMLLFKQVCENKLAVICFRLRGSFSANSCPMFVAFLELAILEGQNMRQKLQALAIIISTHQKKSLSELFRTITVGRCKFL